MICSVEQTKENHDFFVVIWEFIAYLIDYILLFNRSTIEALLNWSDKFNAEQWLNLTDIRGKKWPTINFRLCVSKASKRYFLSLAWCVCNIPLFLNPIQNCEKQTEKFSIMWTQEIDLQHCSTLEANGLFCAIETFNNSLFVHKTKSHCVCLSNARRWNVPSLNHRVTTDGIEWLC